MLLFTPSSLVSRVNVYTTFKKLANLILNYLAQFISPFLLPAIIHVRKGEEACIFSLAPIFYH